MDFTNFAIVYLLLVVHIGGYFWLKKAARKESRYKNVYKYLWESYLLVSLLITITVELLGMVF